MNMPRSLTLVDGWTRSDPTQTLNAAGRLQLMSTRGGTPDQQISVGIQLQTVSPHPRCDVINAGGQTQLEV